MEGCCQDLEQRVAELEATTVRKGNRKVSLELYGQVNRALLLWDDGLRSNAYVVDNNVSSTRLGAKGEGKIVPGLKSGFDIQFEFTDSSSQNVSQYPTFSKTSGTYAGGDNGAGETGPIALRQGYWYLDSDKVGRVSLGHQSPATDDLTIINLSGAAVASDGRTLWSGSFTIVGSKTGAVGSATSSAPVKPFTYSSTANPAMAGGLRWNNIADGLDTDRGDFLRYDTPSIFGFILSTAWGENDQWDIAVRYKQEWNSFRVAGGVGYYYSGDGVDSFDGYMIANNVINGNMWGSPDGFSNGANTRRQEVKGSLSVMHIPTGLYVSLASGERDSRGDAPQADFWYLQGGIDKRFFPVGATTLYGEYGGYSNFGVNAYAISGTNLAGPVVYPATAPTVQNGNGMVPGPQVNAISDSSVNRWGAGVVQKFDAAALEVYGVYQHWEADVSYYTVVTPTTMVTAKAPTDAFNSFSLGGRVKF
jgi:hypothetical protein